MFIIAFSLGWYLTKKIYLNEGKTVQQLDTLFVYTAVATLVGARLGDCFFYNWDYFKDHLLEIFLPIKEKPDGSWEPTGFSGLASHGAAIGIIIAMILYVRKYKDISLSWILDRVVIPITIGGMFVRFGNFFNSEINGKEVSDTFPLGVKFVQGGAISHCSRPTFLRNISLHSLPTPCTIIRSLWLFLSVLGIVVRVLEN